MFELSLQLLSTLVILAFIKLRLSIDIPLSLPLGKKREVFSSVHFYFSVSERFFSKEIHGPTEIRNFSSSVEKRTSEISYLQVTM